MIAVDTNVLVRLIVNDPDSKQQVNLAKALLRQAKRIYVPQIVQIELVWVLETSYGFDKLSVIKVLKHLQQQSVFILQHETLFSVALEIFENNSADFSDYLILSARLENKHELYTFDKKFARIKSVKFLDEKAMANG